MNKSLIVVLAILLFACNNKEKESTGKNDALAFDETNYTLEEVEVNGEKIRYRAYENIIYVSKPIDTTYQKLNYYVPESYFEGKAIGEYDASTAPIFFPNSISTDLFLFIYNLPGRLTYYVIIFGKL